MPKRIIIMKRPKEVFATGNVMHTDINGRIYKGSFRTVDPGEKGGLQIVHGKLASDVERLGREEASTKTQKYTVEQKDFTIREGRLIPTTARGRRELKDIKADVGELTYLGEKKFIPVKEISRFEEYTYLGGSKRMPKRYGRGISPQEITGARRRGVPETIISKMGRGAELTEREKEILNAKGLGYKQPFTKRDGTRVRAQTFALKGGRKRGRTGGGSGRSSNPSKSPIEVKPGLPRGAYS